MLSIRMVRLELWYCTALLSLSLGFGAVTPPKITSFSPTAVNVGTFTVTITGSGFQTGAKVNLNGTPVTTKFMSDTQVSFTATVNSAGNVAISVSNPAPNAANSNDKALNVMPPITVNGHPDTMFTMRAGTQHKFTVTVSNAVDKTVVWSVNGIAGGNKVLGMIAADGTYDAPPVPPNPNVIQLGVASTVDPKATDTIAVTLNNPTPVITSVSPSTLTIGKSVAFSINGTGFVGGAIVKRGGVALNATVVSSTRIDVTGEVPASPGGVTVLTVANIAPGPATSKALVVPVAPANATMSYLAAARFLEQAAFGPSPADIAHLQQLGIDAWIAEQMTLPPSPYRNYGTAGLDKNQSEFFVHATAGQNQLRQRVTHALSEIFVVSGVKTTESRQVANFLNQLSSNAFGNFRKLLRDVTLNAAMGDYLDMVNNDKANPVTGVLPNENYAREVLQLFTIGIVPLNPDGTPGTGTNYNQSTIADLARAFTGWTYYSTRGAPAHGHNEPNYEGPMLPVEANHDTGAKTVLGTTLPAGHTATQDLDAAIDAIFAHPNVGPFISLRLIEQLVTSNPSPAYMTRVVSKFNNNGQGVRGDLAAVIHAILTDPEARAGDAPNAITPANFGHLREPILFLIGLLRALDATVIVQNPLESAGTDMGQKLFYSPSVFNYYSPLTRIPAGIYGPEFQIFSPATTLARANVVYNLIVNGLDRDVRFNTNVFSTIAGDPAALVNVIDNALLYGRLPSALRGYITTAVNATTDHNERLKTALYLIASSPEYQVAH